jgi:hypothetical protein
LNIFASILIRVLVCFSSDEVHVFKMSCDCLFRSLRLIGGILVGLVFPSQN